MNDATRLDRIDLLQFVGSKHSPIKVLFASIIQDAVVQYLYAFTKTSEVSPEEFFYSCQYFFNITSTNKDSWDNNHLITHQQREGQAILKCDHYLTDNELQLMCFDKHYDLSDLSKHMDINKFRAGLKVKRRQILEQEWESVTAHIAGLYKKELASIPLGNQTPLNIWDADLKETLVCPANPLDLASKVMVPKRLKKNKSKRKLVTVSQGVDVLTNLQPLTLEPNWGPLSELGIDG